MTKIYTTYREFDWDTMPADLNEYMNTKLPQKEYQVWYYAGGYVVNAEKNRVRILFKRAPIATLNGIDVTDPKVTFMLTRDWRDRKVAVAVKNALLSSGRPDTAKCLRLMYTRECYGVKKIYRKYGRRITDFIISRAA